MDMEKLGPKLEKGMYILAAFMLIAIAILTFSRFFIPAESKMNEERKDLMEAGNTIIEQEEEESEKKIVINNTKTTIDGYELFKMTKDYDVLKKIIYLEAKGETLEGKKEVARVILNRVKSKNFPNNIYDVVYQPKQFSPSHLIEDTEIEDDYLEEIEYAILSVYTENKKGIEVSSSLYFVNPTIADRGALRWMENSLTYNKTIGDHVFYE